MHEEHDDGFDDEEAGADSGATALLTAEQLIEASDLDGLVRLVDGLASNRDWGAITGLMERCDEAVERGKQVWGVRHYGEYRLALDAPGDIAATVLLPGAGRFAPGPLWEVAASTHTWEELAPHVLDPYVRGLIAQERALRGDRLPSDLVVAGAEIPLARTAWEPVYTAATYRGDGVDMSGPEVPDLAWVELGEAGTVSDETAVAEALLDVVRHWLDDSSARGEAVAVEGDACSAIRALGPHRARVAAVDLSVAMDVMTWAGASGGAFGRRRGTPAGRTAAWWTLAVVLGMEDDWPADPTVIGEEGATLDWLVWDPGDQTGGWSYHLAVSDPEVGLSWAVSAVDAR